ncbi:hypothetical protein HG1285_07859 [Hydrogenivirga sp. 128-5-R1-1]|nr:hypothetical protein HG1285_07859 [Hydrogenivirga sp. 128-5-R1-1]
MGCHGVNGDGKSQAAQFSKTNHQTFTLQYLDGNQHQKVAYLQMRIYFMY